MLHTTTPNAGARLTQSGRGALIGALLGSLIFCAGLALYWPLLQFTFFVEDPADIGQVDGHSYAELVLLPNSNLYYHPDGSFTLALVGSISVASASVAPIGRVSDIAEVLGGTVELRDGSVIASVRWRSQRAAGPSDTLFVHILDANGRLVAQEDGNSLGGLIFPSAWRPGNEVLDRRIIMLTTPLPAGLYRVTAGMYDRVTATRYTAYTASGTPIPDGELEVSKFIVK